jgi:hypothetical protein
LHFRFRFVGKQLNGKHIPFATPFGGRHSLQRRQKVF